MYGADSFVLPFQGKWMGQVTGRCPVLNCVVPLAQWQQGQRNR